MKNSTLDKIPLQNLAELISKSDKEAFNTLFGLLWDPMYTYAISIIMDTAIAKDLVQEVWIDYWQRREYVEVQNIKSYLYKAIRYRCYNNLRNSMFNKIQLETANSITVNPDVELEENVIALETKIYQSIQALPERCQEIFRLSRVNFMSNKEIANQLNISQRSVENQISLALSKLRKDLSFVKYLLF